MRPWARVPGATHSPHAPHASTAGEEGQDLIPVVCSVVRPILTPVRDSMQIQDGDASLAHHLDGYPIRLLCSHASSPRLSHAHHLHAYPIRLLCSHSAHTPLSLLTTRTLPGQA